MHSKRCLIRSWVALLTALMFAFGIVFTPAGKSWALSPSEEKKIGEELLELIRQQMPLIEDGEILTYVQSVGNRIVRQMGTTQFPYRFFVVDEAVPNAFAIPGGYVFVYRGLLEMMETEGELGGILSHELAHLQARHIHRQMEEMKLVGIASLVGALAGILLGVGGAGSLGPALMVGSLAGGRSFALKYSRDFEEEADQLGFRYLCECGYEPKDMVGVMTKLNERSWLSNSKVPSYLMTHPMLSDRILYLQELIKKHRTGGDKTTKTRVGDFPLFKAALLAEFNPSDITRNKLEAEQKKGNPAGTYGLGRLSLRQGNAGEAVSYLQEAARQKPDSALVLSTLGVAYQQLGRHDDAQRVFQSALKIDPTAPNAHFRLSGLLLEQGKKEEALDHLKQIEEMAPNFPEIDNQLGIVLGRMNRLGEAHDHLGSYYRHKLEWKTAIYHYRKARANMTAESERKTEIDEILKDIEKKKTESEYRKARK